MSTVTEIADSVFRISTFVRETNIQFNQFLVRDAEPLLYHTGHRRLFAKVRDAVATLLAPESLRWIGFSHIEADECGALAEWQRLAPGATAFCSRVGKRIGVDDFIAIRPARALGDGENFATGRFRFRFLQTPQVPHGWDASVLFEETQGVLFCSDLFHQNGDVEPIARTDLVGRFPPDARRQPQCSDAGLPPVHAAHCCDAQTPRRAEAEGARGDALIRLPRRRRTGPSGCCRDDARSARPKHRVAGSPTIGERVTQRAS